MVNKLMKQGCLAGMLIFASWNAMAEVSIIEAYARALPPGQENTAAFMLLKNDGEKAIQLLSGESSATEHVELHTHTNVDGVMQMRKIDLIDIPAGGSTELKPGSYHVMLIGADPNKLAVGQEIKLNLEFSDGSSQEITLPVKKVAAHMHMKKEH